MDLSCPGRCRKRRSEVLFREGAGGLSIPGEGTKYGAWSVYIPGPRKEIPWLHLHDMDDWSAPDTLVAGGVYQPGKGLHLLTPLVSGT